MKCKVNYILVIQRIGSTFPIFSDTSLYRAARKRKLFTSNESCFFELTHDLFLCLHVYKYVKYLLVFYVPTKKMPELGRQN